MKITPRRVINIIVLEYTGLFGLAVFIAGFMRSATPFLIDTFTEIAIALLGLFLFLGVAQAQIKLIRSKGNRVTKSGKLPGYPGDILIIAFVLMIVVMFGLQRLGLPNIVTMILAAGAEFGSLLLRVVDITFRNKFDLDWVGVFFAGIPWLFQFVFMAEVTNLISGKIKR